MKSKQKHSRWSNWENDVLAKCGNLSKLQSTIKRRQAEINGDSQERETLQEQFFEFIRLNGENPNSAFVKIKVNDLYHFLQRRYPREIGGRNKVKAFVERHHIPEIVGHKKTKYGAVFVFRGADAPEDAKLRFLRGRSGD